MEEIEDKDTRKAGLMLALRVFFYCVKTLNRRKRALLSKFTVNYLLAYDTKVLIIKGKDG